MQRGNSIYNNYQRSAGEIRRYVGSERKFPLSVKKITPKPDLVAKRDPAGSEYQQKRWLKRLYFYESILTYTK